MPMLTKETLEVFDSTGTMMWISTQNPDFTYYNLAWRRYAGWTMEGPVWNQGVHPADRDRVIAEFRAIFEKREHYSIQFRIQTPQGDYKLFQDQGRPWYEQDGSFGGFIGSVTAIEPAREGVAAQTQRHESLSLASV